MKNTGNGKREIYRQITAWMLAVVFVMMSILPTITAHAENTKETIDSIDFADFSNWRSGCYSWTDGKYMKYDTRLCLKDYATYDSSTYRVHITNSVYRMLVRELDSAGNFKRSCTLANGDQYTPGKDAVYLAIGIYKSDWESRMNYDTYKSMFDNGFRAELVAVKSNIPSAPEQGTKDESTEGTSTDTASKYYDIDSLDLNVFSNWRSGYYDYTTGQYDASNTKRICLNKYAVYTGSAYQVGISNTEYRLLIREMDADMRFIKSYTMADGETYTPGKNARYLGISLYKTGWENTSYESMKQLFAKGFQVSLKVKTTETDDITAAPDIGAQTTASGRKAVYDILGKLITTGNSSKVDVSAYKLTFDDFFKGIVPEFKQNYVIELNSGQGVSPAGQMKGDYLQYVWIANMDENYLTRLEHVRKSVKEYTDAVDDRMSDLEKVLLAHEYIVNLTEYKNDNAFSHFPSGPLGNGYGVCDGYEMAMALLLNQVGIETDDVSSAGMNHAWLYVRIDGCWYHVDPTWDDTQKGSDEQYMHRFLIRNDAEFETIYASRSHYGWRTCLTKDKSTSTRYEDWFVHDVAGTMYYADGLWYYRDIETNSIMCADINGNRMRTVVDGLGLDKIKLQGIENHQLIYSIGKTQYSKSI